MSDPIKYAFGDGMFHGAVISGNDSHTTITFTLPPAYKWTDAETALKDAHDREYEIRMQYFWECQRLKSEVERLRKAGDAMAKQLIYEDYSYELEPCKGWLAAKGGKGQ